MSTVIISYSFFIEDYSTVTQLRDLTHNSKYVPCLSFKYICKTNRFVYHKKELIETEEYTDFDIVFRSRV